MRDPRYYFGFGYGSDINGLAHQSVPNPKQQVRYPFKSFDGKVTFDRQKTGTRTFDFNKDGVAHYGQYPDWFENLRQIEGDAITKEMFRGAEAYLQMWERTYGVPRTTCLAPKAAFKRTGIGKLRLADRPEALLRRAGQPAARPGAVYRYCVRGSSRFASATFAQERQGRARGDDGARTARGQDPARVEGRGPRRKGQEPQGRPLGRPRGQERRASGLPGAQGARRRHRRRHALARAQPRRAALSAPRRDARALRQAGHARPPRRPPPWRGSAPPTATPSRSATASCSAG